MSLEHYKKQAKLLVRWHREGNYSVGGRIRGLARYRHLTDAEALELPFRLNDAQEIIAREAGFEDWTALKTALEAGSANPRAPRRPPDAAAIIKTAIPILLVSNVAATSAFFRDKLGFTIDFLHGHPAFYAGVSRGGVTLHLRFVHEPPITEDLRDAESLLAALVLVDNVKTLFQEYKTNGVPLVGTLRKEPWGGPTFTVRDPDGNRICFCAA